MLAPSWDQGKIESDSSQEDSKMNRTPFIPALVFGLCFLLPRIASAEPATDDAVTVKFYVAESNPAAGLKQAQVEGDNRKVVYLHTEPVLTRDDIAAARVIMDNNNRPAIDVGFTKAGQEKMGKATGENIGKRLAIVVNGKVISAPTIRSKITDRAQVTGVFSKGEAEKLAQGIQPPDQKSP
jgi:preprotein translocase subunit SecD